MKKIIPIFFILCFSIFSEVTLNFWGEFPQGTIKREVLESKIREFEFKNPSININVIDSGAPDMLEAKLYDAMSKGENPELLWWGPQATGKLAKTGKLVKAQEYIDTDKVFDKDDIYESLWEVSKYRGEIWTLPFDANNLAVYYNKELFEKENINPNNIRSWDDLREAAIKLTKDNNGDGEIDQYGIQIPFGRGEWTVWIWQTLLWQQGGEFLSGENMNEVSFYSAAGIEALNYWKDLLEKSKAGYLSEKDRGWDPKDFLNQKTAMTINGPWNNGVLKKEAKFEYGAIYLPSDISRATNIGGENLFIFRSTKEKEEASWKFAKFIMSSDFQVEFAIATGYLPVCQSARSNEKYKEFLKENTFIKVYVEQMRYGKARPSIPEYNKISSYLGLQIENYLMGKIGAGKALENAKNYAESVLN